MDHTYSRFDSDLSYDIPRQVMSLKTLAFWTLSPTPGERRIIDEFERYTSGVWVSKEWRKFTV